VDAVVIGSGPNGLAAAVALAREGIRVRIHEAQSSIGGGTRSAELTLPGFVHDVCSAIHPMGAASPFFRELPMREHGLEWIHPEIALAHPLDDGSAVVLVRSLDETASMLGEDARTYRRIIAPVAEHFDDLDLLGPVLRVPAHPWLLGRFAFHAVRSAAALPFEGERARALVAGLAAHASMRLDSAFTGSFPMIFSAAAHAFGWPLAKGGSQAIADALASILRSHGGTIVTGDRIEMLEGDAAYVFDTSAAALERIAGDRLPAPYRRKLRRFPRGPAAFKIDWALSGPVPWRAAECRRAGTVHLGGTFEAIAASEAEVLRGGHPERPFVIATQQSLFDATRAPPGKHTLWAYCHVPNGSTFDMAERIEAQIERFAPGFRDLVLGRHVMAPSDFEAHDENYAGGDISGGSNAGLRLFARPVLARDPYRTPAKDIYLCSSSTPPGPGVHGMCGYRAAASALRQSFTDRDGRRSARAGRG
jgi:phytoene dehydrogenase-like protein